MCITKASNNTFVCIFVMHVSVVWYFLFRGSSAGSFAGIGGQEINDVISTTIH